MGRSDWCSEAFEWMCAFAMGELVYIICVFGLLFSGGCACEPPRSLSIDPRFSPLEQAQIRDAVDQWCATNGWCPDVGVEQEAQAHIWRDTDEEFSRFEDKPGVWGHTVNSSDTVHILGTGLDSWPEMTWLVVAHELGHLQNIDHHGSSGCTMFWEQSEPAYQLTCE